MALLRYALRFTFPARPHINFIKYRLQHKVANNELHFPEHDDSSPSYGHLLTKNNIPEEERQEINNELDNMLEDWIPLEDVHIEKDEDIYSNSITWFTLFFGFIGTLYFGLWYYPDRGNYGWAMTEAYLEIERRKRDGLPLVDPNLVPLSQIKLPTDEELGPDFKIVL